MKMKAAILGMLIVMVTGCSPLANVPHEQLSGLSADQITALTNAGPKVRACLQVGGPPVGGAGTILIVPGDDAGVYQFGPDCHLR